MIGSYINNLSQFNMSMINVTKTIGDVVDYFDNMTTQIMRGVFNKIDDFKFISKPVFINQEKLGHLSTSSPLSFIISQNEQLSEERSEPIDVCLTISLIANKMNEWLSKAKVKNVSSIVHKISHFTEHYGTICLFFADQILIEAICNSFSRLESIDEEEHEDWYLQQFNNDENLTVSKDSEIDSESEDESDSEVEPHLETLYNTIGKIESIFREINGIPTIDGFAVEFRSRIVLNSSNVFSTINKIRDWKYVLIEHYFRKEDDVFLRNVEATTNEKGDKELIDMSQYSTWTLAQVENMNDSTIFINGPALQHNADVLNITQIDSNFTFENNKNIWLDGFSQKIINKWNLNSDKQSTEEIITKELESPSKLDLRIKYLDSVMIDLKEISDQGKLDFFFSADEVIKTINVNFNLNPNCIRTRTKNLNKEIWAIAMDNLTIIYEENKSSVNILKTIWNTYFIETGSQHTKEWLNSLSNALNIERLLSLGN